MGYMFLARYNAVTWMNAEEGRGRGRGRGRGGTLPLIAGFHHHDFLVSGDTRFTETFGPGVGLVNFCPFLGFSSRYTSSIRTPSHSHVVIKLPLLCYDCVLITTN